MQGPSPSLGAEMANTPHSQISHKGDTFGQVLDEGDQGDCVPMLNGSLALMVTEPLFAK